MTLTEIPVVLAIDPDVADTEAVVVPDATFTSVMPVVGLLVTLAESSGRLAVALLTSTHRAANRLQRRHARRDGDESCRCRAAVHARRCR